MTIQKIKSDLENDIIDYNEACERIRNMSKPWEAKKWETDKKKLTKTHCEQCGQTGAMVLTHLSYPTALKDIMQELLSELYYKTSDDSYVPTVTDEEVQSFIREESQTRDACPKCKRVALRRRKNYGSKFVCCNCTYEFDVPVEVRYWSRYKKEIVASDVKRYLELQKVQNYKQEKRRQLFEENKLQLGKQALLRSIDQFIKYISFENTATFCKTCVLKMEGRQQLLCYGCKENYFNFEQQDNCNDCKKKGIKTPNPYKVLVLEMFRRKREFDLYFPINASISTGNGRHLDVCEKV